MAERLIAAVLKTAVGDEPTVGSNPSLSALKAPLGVLFYLAQPSLTVLSVMRKVDSPPSIISIPASTRPCMA